VARTEIYSDPVPVVVAAGAVVLLALGPVPAQEPTRDAILAA